MEVDRRSKAKLARPLHRKRSGPSSAVESAHQGVPPRSEPSASSSIRKVAPNLRRPTARRSRPRLRARLQRAFQPPGFPQIGPSSRTLRWTEPS